MRRVVKNRLSLKTENEINRHWNMYNAKSTIATEFISDSEIRSTMEYAVSNCSDRVLIEFQ